MSSKKKAARTSPKGGLPKDVTFRRPTRKEMDAAFRKTIRRHGETLRALGDASGLSSRSKRVRAAIDVIHERYGRALDELGDSSGLPKPKGD